MMMMYPYKEPYVTHSQRTVATGPNANSMAPTTATVKYDSTIEWAAYFPQSRTASAACLCVFKCINYLRKPI